MSTKLCKHIFCTERRLSALLKAGLIAFFMLFIQPLFAQDDILTKRFSFNPQRTSLFDALNTISKKTGYLFIYDSRIIENDRKVRLEAKNDPLYQILGSIFNDPALKYKVISKHILVYKENTHRIQQVQISNPDTTQQIISIKGKIWDKYQQKPIQYASVAIEGTTMGTVSNSEGVFIIKANRKLAGKNIVITHIGYTPYKLPIEIGEEQMVDIYLQPEIVSLQEVVIRRINPEDIIERAVRSRKYHYPKEPIYLTTFYREQVQKDSKYLSYAEGLFKIYKPSFEQLFGNDQIKELKSRKIINIDNSDTLVMKIKGGISSCLSLDIVCSTPDFIDPSEMTKYRYSLSDIVTFDSRNAYSIYFEQRPDIDEPLYSGNIYIDTDSLTILGADFEINPLYIQKATPYLITQNSRTHVIKPERFAYSVSYRKVNGSFYLNHAQCSISIKARKKGRLFSSKYTGVMEMATCNIEVKNVSRFNRIETIKPQTIYLDIPYQYDGNFWGDFNTITPEEKISEALKRISVKIEKMEQ